MKKIVIYCLLLVFIFSGCGIHEDIKSEKIKVDLEKYFANSEYVINEINVNRIKENKDLKQQMIDVNVNMTTPDAIVEREFSLEYNYYKKGNWMLDGCHEINTENWRAEPLNMPKFTKKEIADLIFDNHKLKSNISNAYFTTWTAVYRESVMFEGLHMEPEDYIYKIERSDDKEDYNYAQEEKFSIIVYIKAKSPAFTICEEVEIDWIFNPISLKWENFEIYSVGHRVENWETLIGKYMYEPGYGLSSPWYIKIENVSSEGIITAIMTSLSPGEDRLINERWKITGLHEASYIAGEKKETRTEHMDLIICFNPGKVIAFKGNGSGGTEIFVKE